MTKIKDLAVVAEKTRQNLANNQLRTTQELWRAIGDDFEEGLAKVRNDTGVSEVETVSLLGAELFQPPSRWPTIKDYLLGVAALVLLLLSLYRIAEGYGCGLRWQLLSPEPTRVVVATRDLAALDLVTEARIRLTPSRLFGVQTVEKVVGRRLLMSVPQGEAITEDHLTPVGIEDEDLEGKLLLDIAVNRAGEAAGLVEGSEVSLLLSPSALSGLGGIEVAALLLHVDSSSDEPVITVAVAVDRVSEITRRLANSKVVVARACCPD